MNLEEFHTKFHKELPYYETFGDKTAKILQPDGGVLEVAQVEYEPETKTLWIKVDG